MSYFPEDIPFMSEEERKANGIKTAKEIETQKTQLSEEDATFDCVSRQAALDIAFKYCPDDDGTCSEAGSDMRNMLDEIEALPPAQPQRIQNNAVHLCDSCQYTYVTCPSHGNDAVFGDGKGNDNICACNKYRPISEQPQRPKGYMKIKVISAVDGEGLFCENCDAYCLSPFYNFCTKCGVEFIGVRA